MHPSLPLLLAAATAATAQFVPAPTNLTTTKGFLDLPVRYKQVPTGICELDPNVKSFSGYVDVSEDEHIFWWFFEARNGNPSEAPLTVWINGGPGSSSMIGLFQENGPCSVDAHGKLHNNPYSWSNVSNMIYIDQPAQVGFSYSTLVNGYINPSGSLLVTLPDATCPDYVTDASCGTYSYANASVTTNSTQAGAPTFWKTLQGFMGAFPQYSRNEFHFATESYGGHFAPIYSEYIQSQNAKNISGATQIALRSVYIGNGWFDPLSHYPAYYNFTVSPGNTYDYSPYNETFRAQLYDTLWGHGNCIDQLKDCAASGRDDICREADYFCFNLVEEFYDIHTGRDEYDMRELAPSPFPPWNFEDYLNTPQVQAAIGAYQNYTIRSNKVAIAFAGTGDDAREAGTIEAMRTLLDHDVHVALVYGDADYSTNWLGGEVVAAKIDAPGFAAAGYGNISTSDALVHGQVKQAGLFSFSRIYDAGHEVPFFQPLAALELFARLISRRDLQSGAVALDAHRTYASLGSPACAYRQGNATMQWQFLPLDANYNTTLNGPNPGPGGAPPKGKRGLREVGAARLGRGYRGARRRLTQARRGV